MAEIVVGSSVTANQLKDLFRQIADGSLGGGHIQAVLEHRNPFEKTDVAQAAQNTITVIPNLSIEERIALGVYDWKNPNITKERFSHDPSTVGEWEFDLYHPNLELSTDAAILGAEVDGWTVAKWEHLFAFGEAFPEEQRKYPIIALGSVCQVLFFRCVLVLFYDGRRRRVNLSRRAGDWYPRCRFLRVRKVQRSVA